MEIEFAGLDARSAAEVLWRELGGRISFDGPHRAQLSASALGDFAIELDMAVAHLKGPLGDNDVGNALERKLREWLGTLGGLVMPMEISSPPLQIADLDRMDAAVQALADAGAEGTDAGLLFAFGMHLNPEAAELSADYITAVLKAYLPLSAWLRAGIGVDRLRLLSSFVDPFPTDYCRLVAAETYNPPIARLIADYLEYNPSRNRELDLLPLFAFIAPERVLGQLPGVKIKPRPTFHYRLPNALLGRPGWSIAGEWKRWLVVERLADTPELLAEVLNAYRRHLAEAFSGEWLGGDWLGGDWLGGDWLGGDWACECERLIADRLLRGSGLQISQSRPTGA